MKNFAKLVTAVILLAVSMQLSAAPVNINTADAKALATNIKGVGAKKAEAIVQYRSEHGPFKKPEDLTKIKGIGPKLIEKNKDVILVKN
ncbi:MAG: helix-hairpin-helix domain-containing protein [Proteobacteria bacterium]|jgi:competence protein ComEA|nr:helix-hairpin-helix domain-containing protein [Pseudomonadota bacterium]MCG6935526.1 helix-hairpin-helix domain-containing protein [Pseudomonadota bacterium]